MRPANVPRLEFGWFGSRVELSSDSRPLRQLVCRLWGGSSPPPSDGAPTRRYAVELGGDGPTYEGPGGRLMLDRREPLLHAYNLFVSDLLGCLGSHFALHATTVVRGGGGLLVAGPSTFGKTTLAVHLARRGFALLSDDVTFLERRSGRAVPFPRALHLRAGTRRTLPEEDLESASKAAEDASLDEWTLPPGAWLPVASESVPLRTVAILRPRADGAGVRRFPLYDIRAAAGHEGLLEELEALDGVRGAEPVDGAPGRVLVRVDRAGALADWLGRHRQVVVSAVKMAASAPGFDDPPALERIGTFQAALELGQEMLNRHPGSRLAEEFEGREAELVMELGEMLRAARCHALLPGRLEETLDLLVQAFESA